MKAEILKLAGVKNEKEFYKKFPTEEAFMAKYGKKLEKLKKAKIGDYISSDPGSNFKPLSFSDVSNAVQTSLTGISTADRNRQEDVALKQSQIDATKNSGGGLMGILSQNSKGIGQALSAALGGGEGGIDMSAATSAIGAKNGKKMKKAENGVPLDALNYMNNGSLPADTTASATGGFADNIFGSQLKGSVNAANPANIKGMSGIGQIAGKLKGALPGLANQAGSILGSIQQIGAEKRQVKELQKAAGVSNVVAQAAASRPEQQQRRYVRPEDSLVNNTRPQGAGTNYLAAENGAEIMNTYAPDVIYTDLGYEPLDDSNKVKAFKKGGKMKKADLGAILNPLSGVGGQLGSWAGSAATGGKRPGAAGQLGSTIGGTLGMAFGPLGSFIGSTAGGFLGSVIGGDGERQKQMEEAQDAITANTLNATGSAYARNIQGANSSFMEHGGWVSHDWQPQVIAKFGEHDVDDLLKPDPMMDTLRAGGHLKYYTPPSERAMYTGKAEDGVQVAMDGDLEVYRGEAETISTNPYLPNDGETVMFKGPSHDDGGMPISYGANGVEVEGGEPAIVMKDGGQKDNLVVFGNMYIPDYGAKEIGDPKAKGMKFKRYIADLSKQEDKQNKIMTKATDLINSSDTDDPFDLLAFNSGKAMSLGANMKLKNLAEKKMNTAAVQNAILDTAEEYGLDSAKLSKKNMAAFGGKFTSSPIAENGYNVGDIAPLAPQPMNYDVLQGLPSSVRPKAPEFIQVPFKPGYSSELESVVVNAKKPTPSPTTDDSSDEVSNNKGKFDWASVAQLAATSAAPFLRPRTVNPLDPSQTYPEMMAAAMNQLEPVPMQSYEPIIPSAPSRVSYQDQLNEITAQSRAAERMAASNPGAAAALFGQVAQAKNKVLAEQFRANQVIDQQYNEMRAQVLNDAKLKNLAMFDQQAVRQAEAKSKTKAQAIEIAKSLSDKIAQNKLENRQLRVMENMYPAFSFTSEGTAYKNPLYQALFNTAGVSNLKAKDVAPEGYEFETVLKKKKDTAKNGTIVKAFKNF